MTHHDPHSRVDDPTEGSWVYLSGPLQATEPEAAKALYDRLAEACESSGYYAYRPYAEISQGGGLEAPLSPRLRHAVRHAEACVFYIGKPSSGVGTELAWATEDGRPIIAVQLRGDQPSPVLTSLLTEYERAELLLCDDAEDCADKLRETLSDPRWHDVFRAAGAELAEDLP